MIEPVISRTSADMRADLDVVYRAEAPRMWRALLAFSGDREIASDAVAEAFAQAIRRGDAIRSLRRWVWKSAYNIAAGELKRRSNLRFDVIDQPTEPVEPAWELRSALTRCSSSQRAALILYYYAGYQSSEIARMIGSTPAAVRVHLMRGRRRIRELLEEVARD
jgi:RNA polymerase sigma-70 factor (ECF subfamily)